MIVMQLGILALVAAAAAGVVLTREPGKQAIGISFFGLMLAIMFYIFQAPDVALSQLVIGVVALPLMVLLSVARIRVSEIERRANGEKSADSQKENMDSRGGQPSQRAQAANEQKRGGAGPAEATP